MPKFKKEVNLDPRSIKEMSLAQKQDCMTEIESRRSLAWKYSVIFCLGTMIFVFVYAMVSLVFTMRFQKMLESVHPLFFLIPVFVFAPSFFAHSMNGGCVLWAVLTYMLIGFLTIISGSWVNAWVAPFALAGAVIYVRMSRACEAYDALSKEDGFPEFCAIESKSEFAREIIERNAAKEKPLDPLTEAAISAAEAGEEEKTENS